MQVINSVQDKTTEFVVPRRKYLQLEAENTLLKRKIDLINNNKAISDEKKIAEKPKDFKKLYIEKWKRVCEREAQRRNDYWKGEMVFRSMYYDFKNDDEFFAYCVDNDFQSKYPIN